MTPTLNSSLQISGWSAGGGDFFDLGFLALGFLNLGFLDWDLGLGFLDCDLGSDFLLLGRRMISPGERCSRASKSAMRLLRLSIWDDDVDDCVCLCLCLCVVIQYYKDGIK